MDVKVEREKQIKINTFIYSLSNKLCGKGWQMGKPLRGQTD